MNNIISAGFDHMFVSLNRFEGKKNHQLAIDAFGKILTITLFNDVLS